MAAILQSHLAAHGGRISSAYFSVNCLLNILINYTENVTDLYAHAQTVDTRRSSPIFQAPGYKATSRPVFLGRCGSLYACRDLSYFYLIFPAVLSPCKASTT